MNWMSKLKDMYAQLKKLIAMNVAKFEIFQNVNNYLKNTAGPYERYIHEPVIFTRFNARRIKHFFFSFLF